jgi:hypothetical protein
LRKIKQGVLSALQFFIFVKKLLFMDRRQAVKALGTMAGAGLLLPEAVLARTGETLEGTPPPRRFFNGTEKRIVAAFAECVVPRTDTPGAADAGVAGWVEVLVQDCYDFDDQLDFREGLMEIDQAARDKSRKAFVKLSYDEQVSLLTDIERADIARSKANPNVGPTFIRTFKDLIKFVYASTERGATEAFAYLQLPGRYDGAMTLAPNQKVWVDP